MARITDRRVTGGARLSRRQILRTVATGAVAATVSPFSVNLARGAGATIRIGFPVPLTGPYGLEAREQVRGAQLAVDEFNAAGGLDGRMAELLVRDDRLDPAEAVSRVRDLMEKDKVNFLCGSLSASVQLAVNEVARARGMLFMSISQSDRINEASDFSKYTFHEAMTPHMTAGAVGRYAFPRHGRRVAYLHADYAFGAETVRGFKREGEKQGVETVAEIAHPVGEKDFSGLLKRIQAARPDVLCLCNFGADQFNAIGQAADLGLKDTMTLIVPALSFRQRLAGGGAWDGVIGGTNYYWGLETTIPSAKALNDAWRRRNEGDPPSDYGAYGYTGVCMLLEGIRAAGGTDTDKVIATLENLRYDKSKGEQYYRKCDHQSVQQVFVVESKPAAEMTDSWDAFTIVHTEPAAETNLRNCGDL